MALALVALYAAILATPVVLIAHTDPITWKEDDRL